jgi:hypothetical protein
MQYGGPVKQGQAIEIDEKINTTPSMVRKKKEFQ